MGIPLIIPQHITAKWSFLWT